jgi:Spy/CpxP family protein refolding chaperone
MNLLTPKQAAWVKVVCQLIMWSFAAGTLAITSGSKMWGVIAAVVLSLATNIYHTLAASPNDAPSQKPMDGIGNP